jgi:hypothetical protein
MSLIRSLVPTCRIRRVWFSAAQAVRPLLERLAGKQVVAGILHVSTRIEHVLVRVLFGERGIYCTKLPVNR